MKKEQRETDGKNSKTTVKQWAIERTSLRIWTFPYWAGTRRKMTQPLILEPLLGSYAGVIGIDQQEFAPARSLPRILDPKMITTEILQPAFRVTISVMTEPVLIVRTFLPILGSYPEFKVELTTHQLGHKLSDCHVV
jgi:hypothetical protein